jgi:hypothetical protein
VLLPPGSFPLKLPKRLSGRGWNDAPSDSLGPKRQELKLEVLLPMFDTVPRVFSTENTVGRITRAFVTDRRETAETTLVQASASLAK